jgi:hypothetical protein
MNDSYYVKQKKVVRELAQTLKQDLRIASSYEETKDVLYESLREVLFNNNAFIYYQPEDLASFVLPEGTTLDVLGLNMKDAKAVKDFEELCSFFFKFRFGKIISNTRKREVVMARHLIATWLHENTTWSLKSIGKYMNRDHSSIIHAKDNIYSLITVDKPTIIFWKNFKEYLDVYHRKHITERLGKTLEESGGATIEDREADSGETYESKRVSKV